MKTFVCVSFESRKFDHDFTESNIQRSFHTAAANSNSNYQCSSSILLTGPSHAVLLASTEVPSATSRQYNFCIDLGYIMMPRSCRGKWSSNQQSRSFSQQNGQKPRDLPNSMQYRRVNETDSEDEDDIDANEEDIEYSSESDNDNDEKKCPIKPTAT